MTCTKTGAIAPVFFYVGKTLLPSSLTITFLEKLFAKAN